MGSIYEKPFTAAAFILPLALIYIYKKCPFIVRISGIMCIISILTRFLMADFKEVDFVMDKLPVQFLFLNSFFAFIFIIRENTVILLILFVLACCLRLWWCEKLDHKADSLSIGLSNLKNSAEREGKAIDEILRGHLESKINQDTIIPMIPNGWYFLMESNELKTGKTKFVTCLGRHFIVTRNELGQISVSDIMCPHSDNDIFINITKPESNLSCSSCVQQIGKESFGIQQDQWPCDEINNYIFVWFHAEKEAPSYYLPTFPEISDGSLISRAKTKHILWSQLQAVLENAADIPHIYSVHGQLLGSDATPKFLIPFKNLFSVNWNNTTWKTSTKINESHIAEMKTEQSVCFLGIPFMSTFIEIKMYGPGLLHFHEIFGPFEIQLLGLNTPYNTLHLKHVLELYSTRSIPQYIINLICRLNFTENYKDTIIWNNFMYIKNPKLVAEDIDIKRFRRYHSQFYSKNSPRFEIL